MTYSKKECAEIIIHQFGDDCRSTLIECDGQTLLVDCHSEALREEIESRSLPLPNLILHTHVAPEHCCEGQSFGNIDIRVHENLRELASDRGAYEQKIKTTWDDPDDWPNSMGRETYSVGGCAVCFPPEKELLITNTFQGGDIIPWGSCELEVIDLPIHGWHACGFILKHKGENIALFIGDLFHDGAQIISYYDLTVCYGGTTLDQLSDTLASIQKIDVELYVPATGPLMDNGPKQARELQEKLEKFNQALSWKSSDFSPAISPDYETVGTWKKFSEGLYQNISWGNTIVCIDESGRALVIDPGPCDYELGEEKRKENFQESFDVLERDCGLKSVDYLLITHIHGDHYDLVPLMQERYAAKLAAWEPLADLIEDPESYPYSCLIPWYNIGTSALTVDERLNRAEPWYWNEIAIETVHLPGHCNIAAGYIFEFRGRKLAITGDQLQGNGEAMGFAGVPTNDFEPFYEGPVLSFQNLVGRGIDLNIGGHGSSFPDCEKVYQESLALNQRALEALAPILRGDDYQSIFRSKEIKEARTRFSDFEN